ncbi:hypothetical protein [Aliivibrio finisterrensis]|uniref:O-antigen ligase domain-containing protein n=1 Tax=Aliivibrio finisterrensis TaxID=511998 RepID=A0A6N6RNZ1_9GAMM|nr:hypothetical protein [Aliivibrio finisterrensis]KAB2823163.1 hypothetical protein F8B77_16775 [Aliivibrio finisterrensis]
MFELFRPVYYFVCFVFGYALVRFDVISLRGIVHTYSKYILITSLFSLFCIIFFDYIGRDLISFYAKDTLIPGRRFTGTFQNPYDFAFIGTLPLTYYLSRFYLNSHKVSILAILSLLVTMAFGQSKSGFVNFLLIAMLLTLFFGFFISKERLMKDWSYWIRITTVPIILISIVAGFFVFFTDEFAYLVNGLIRLSSGGDKSSQIRLEQFNNAVTLINGSGLHLAFGYGSYKSSSLMFESLYSLYIFRYGALSFIYIFSWIVLPVFFLVVLRFKTTKCKHSWLYLVLILFFISAAVAGVGNNVIDQARVPLLYFSLLGAVFSSVNVKGSNNFE